MNNSPNHPQIKAIQFIELNLFSIYVFLRCLQFSLPDSLYDIIWTSSFTCFFFQNSIYFEPWSSSLFFLLKIVISLQNNASLTRGYKFSSRPTRGGRHDSITFLKMKWKICSANSFLEIIKSSHLLQLIAASLGYLVKSTCYFILNRFCSLKYKRDIAFFLITPRVIFFLKF